MLSRKADPVNGILGIVAPGLFLAFLKSSVLMT